MEIKSKICGNVLICYVEGEIDHHTTDEFRNHIDYNMENNPLKHLVLDMSRLEFMDSSGIGALIGRYKKVSSLGGKMVIVNENKQVAKVFEISGIYDIIHSYSNLEQALKEL